MTKDDVYYFHQTPPDLCKELVKHVGLTDEDVVFEPFAGEGAFVEAFPNKANVIQTEIQDGTDYRSVDLETTRIDWVITNPPFRLERTTGKRTNAFYELCDYFAGKTKKGFAFLGNDACLSSFTPKRLQHLRETKGVSISKVVVCSVKKWRGRYFFVIFKNERHDLFDYVSGTF